MIGVDHLIDKSRRIPPPPLQQYLTQLLSLLNIPKHHFILVVYKVQQGQIMFINALSANPTVALLLGGAHMHCVIERNMTVDLKINREK